MNRISSLRLNLLLLAAFFAGAVLVYPSLPERIPIHFGLRGEPDAWVARSLLAWLTLPLVALGLTLLLHAAGAFTARNPYLWNVPEKEKLLALSSAARAPAVSRMRGFMDAMALWIIGLTVTLQVATYQVATGRAERLPAYATAAIVAVLVGVGVSAVGFNRRVAADIREAHRRDAGA